MAMKTRTITRTNRDKPPKLVIYRGIQYQEQMLPEKADRSEIQTLDEWREEARSGKPSRARRAATPTDTAQAAPDSREVKGEGTEGSDEPPVPASEEGMTVAQIEALSYDEMKDLATGEQLDFKANIKKVDLVELLVDHYKAT